MRLFSDKSVQMIIRTKSIVKETEQEFKILVEAKEDCSINHVTLCMAFRGIIPCNGRTRDVLSISCAKRVS